MLGLRRVVDTWWLLQLLIVRYKALLFRTRGVCWWYVRHDDKVDGCVAPADSVVAETVHVQNLSVALTIILTGWVKQNCTLVSTIHQTRAIIQDKIKIFFGRIFKKYDL